MLRWVGLSYLTADRHRAVVQNAYNWSGVRPMPLSAPTRIKNFLSKFHWFTALLLCLVVIAGVFPIVTWFSLHEWYWVNLIAYGAALICVIVLLPLLVFRRSRRYAATGFICAAFLFGLDCLLYSFVVTLEILGPFWLVIGFLMGGIGVFPMALIGCALHRAWPTFWILLRPFAFMAVAGIIGRVAIQHSAQNP